MMRASLPFLSGRITRRQLLAFGFGIGGFSLLLSGGIGYRVLFHRKAAKSGFSLLSAQEVEFIDALAETHFPQNNSLGMSSTDVDIAGGTDRWLTGMESQERMIIRTLLSVIDRWPQLSLSSRKRFSDLSQSERVALLLDWETGNSDAKRGLAELLRTVVALHFFEDPQVLLAVGLKFGCPEIAV
jgi:hypothetical protein